MRNMAIAAKNNIIRLIREEKISQFTVLMNATSKTRALIVDDLPQNRKLLSSMLRLQDVEVIEADSGEQAIELFQQHPVDLVFMDIMMPGINGFEATARIKELQQDRFVPVIMVTAVEEVSGQESAVAAGADDYITKPISMVALNSKLLAMDRIRLLHKKLYEQNCELQSIHAQIQREQKYAEEIFTSAISQHQLRIDGVTVTIEPTTQFSGDIVLQTKRPDGAWCVLLGDFTGHGLPAAIGAVPVSETFYAMSQKSISAETILCELNDKLLRFLPVNMFMGCVLMCYLPGTNELLVWNGGMPEVIVRDGETGKVRESVLSANLPLGIDRMSVDDISLAKVGVKRGDVVVALSDGIIETQDEVGNYYGINSVIGMVENTLPAHLPDTLVSDLKQFMSHGGQFHDDITLVVIENFD